MTRSDTTPLWQRLRLYGPHGIIGLLVIVVLGAYYFGSPRSTPDETENDPKPTPPVEPTTEAAPIPDPGTRHFEVVLESLTWDQARRRCEALGGKLAAIDSPEVQARVVRALPKAPKEDQYFWIGLSDAREENRWTWLSGNPLGFRRWSDGEPNNDKGNEDYAAVVSSPRPRRHGKWTDLQGPRRVHGIVRGFVCEWESAEKRVADVSTDAVAFQGKRYKVFRGPVTWFWADRRCRERGGRLASITSPELNDVISELLPRDDARESFYWIGLTADPATRVWSWPTGAELDFINWRHGEPNNGGGVEHYTAVSSTPKTDLHGEWIDIEGPHIAHDIIGGFVCEWDGKETPKPEADEAVVSAGEGHRYQVIHDAVTWAQAAEGAARRGAHLLTIESEAEWEFVRTRLLKPEGFEAFYWLGLSDHQKEGVWTWTSGTKAAVLKWFHGEPNNHAGREDYASIAASASPAVHARWYDFEGPDQVHDVIVGYICEWEK